MGKSKDGQETSVKITTVSIFSVKVTQGFDTQVCVCVRYLIMPVAVSHLIYHTGSYNAF